MSIKRIKGENKIGILYVVNKEGLQVAKILY